VDEVSGTDRADGIIGTGVPHGDVIVQMRFLTDTNNFFRNKRDSIREPLLQKLVTADIL
jgi:hypothetical protein